MKKLWVWGIILGAFFSCRPSQDRVDRTGEGGVEVVLNHPEPYLLRDEASTLTLRRAFSIDTEKEATEAQGAGDIFDFNVDSEGSIFILCPPKGPDNLIFKYSSEGRLLGSFGRMGQGPHELEYPHDLQITAQDEVWVLESPKNKYHVFNSAGAPIEDKTLSLGFEKIVPLENGTFIVSRLLADDMSAKYFPLVTGLYDSAFQLVKELDRFKSVPNKNLAVSLPEKIVNGIEHVFLCQPAGDRIFAGNSGRGYEILVYDLKGALIRKIRKEYTPVPVAEAYKKEYLKMYEEFMPDYAKKIFFPDDWHPFKSFFGDESGRLFVMTYEAGASAKENLCDVFNEDGVLISRLSLNALGKEQGAILARARGDRLYCVQEKESGYKELVVYRMSWR